MIDYNPLVPRCDRPGVELVVYHNHAGERRLPYCAEHSRLVKHALFIRRQEYEWEHLDPAQPCTAYKDLP